MKNFNNIRKLILIFCCLLSIYTYGQVESPEYVPGQVLVKMKASRTTTQKNALKNQLKASLRRKSPHSKVEVWDIDQSKGEVDIDQLIGQYRNHPDIEYIEPNYYYYLATDDFCIEETIAPTKVISPEMTSRLSASLNTTPNDPMYSDQYGMNNTGQDGGTPDADIDAPEAWDIATGSPSIVVGLIDSGIDWKHPDLINNIWQNLGEDADGDGHVIEWNGSTWIFDPGDINDIDDDGNDYPDDFIGWDFIDEDNDPFDIMGHGTHVAGTIGAEGNNGIGVAGVTWDVQIAALRVFAQQNSSVDVIAKALDYAVMMDMPISNNSYQNVQYSFCMNGALERAKINGHLFVAASGNGNNDNDINPNYPSSCPFDNIISVAATDRNDLLWTQSTNTGSNYGATKVDIAAPGRSIKSTHPYNSYGYRNGTSMATPHVTGACALLWELYPDKTYAEIKTAVLSSVDSLPDLSGKCVSEGRLNLHGTLTYFDGDTIVSCRERDSLALVALYEATDGANWTNTWNLNQQMNTWYGIRIDVNGCVTCIDMDGAFNCIDDPFNFNSGNNLSGSLPVELGNLNNLRGLILSKNNLTDSIPPELGNLNNLRNLALHNNQLSGNIPTEIKNLNNLRNLKLHNNQLDGSILPELGNLNNLQYLFLNNNQLDGSIPPELGNLNNLYSLGLGNNNLNGNIPPELGSLNIVINLDLSNNNLSGNIPTELGNLITLQYLYLYNNQLSGCYDANLINLYYVGTNISDGNNFDVPWEDFRYNGMGVCNNPYPNCRQIDSLTLVSLYNSTNGANWTNTWDLNQPMDTWYGLSLNGFGCIVSLDLSGNNLSGNIPPELGNLNNLQYLFLNNNQLSGNIPPELGNLNNLQFLYLFYNNLSGNIPPELGNLNKVRYLWLNANQLSGNIPPELGNLNNLEYLTVGGNNLDGSIPPELGNLTRLGQFSFGSNQLSGCYDKNLRRFCLTGSNNSISDGNNFDAPWEDFCNTGAGTCVGLVWPGDYNYDGFVNEMDALYWGLAFDNEDSIRPNATVDWQGQQAPDWIIEVEGINGKHQDGDGNGLVNDEDLQVVNDNFGNIHAYNQSVYIASSLVYDAVEAGPVAGHPSYDLYVNSANGDPVSAHGLTAVIDFGDIPIDSVELRLNNSSLNPSDSLVVMDTINNRLHIAITRTDKNNRLCIGPVATFIVVTRDIPSGDSLTFGTNGSVVLANGDMARVADMSVYSNYPSGLASNNLVVGASVIHEQCTIAGSVELNVEGGEPPYSYTWNTGETTGSITGLTPNIYTVTVTDAYGQNKTLSVEVQGEYISMSDEFGNLPECTNSPCPTLLTPGGTIPTDIYKASRTVSSNGSVDGVVQFKAGEIIMLLPGFEAPANKDFSATNDGDCDN